MAGKQWLGRAAAAASQWLTEADGDGRYVLSSVPTCRVNRSASQTITTSTFTAVTFDGERYDTDTIHDTLTNTSRLTCKTAGVYDIFASMEWAVSATNLRLIQIKLNGSTVLAESIVAAIAGGVLTTPMALATQYKLAVNDYVEFIVWQNSGGNLNALLTGNYSPEFGMTRIAGG